MTDEELIWRCTQAVAEFQAAVVPEGEEYAGITAERILIDAGLSEREQIQYMGLVVDRIRASWGDAPAKRSATPRTACHWCRRPFTNPGARGIHESRCRENMARDRRIVRAYEDGMSGTDIARAEAMGWSAVYRILRRSGVSQRTKGAA